MGLKIADLYAELGLDNKKFDKGLNDSEAELDEFGNTVEKSGDKLGSLATIGATMAAAVVASIAAIGAGLFTLGGEFDDAYDKIAVTTGATGKQLDGLKDQTKNLLTSLPTDLESASTAIAGVNQRLGLTGKDAEGIAKQFINVTDMLGGDIATNVETGSKALAQFKVPADKMSGSLDHMFKVSQATGIGFDRLSGLMQTNGNVLQQLGYNFNESASMIGMLDKAGIDVEGTLGAMGKGLSTLAKAGEAPKDAFARLVNEITTMDDPVAATSKAIELFGARGGAKMASDLRSGALGIADFNKMVEANGNTINGSAESTWDWKEKLTMLKNKAMVALEPVAMRVFGAVGDAVEKATPFVMSLVHWVQDELMPALSDLAADVLPVVGDAIMSVGKFIGGTLVPALVKFGGWLMDHKPILLGIAVVIGGALVAAFVSWAWSAAAAAAATLAAMAPVLLIGAAIAALVAGIIWAYKNWDWFRNAVDAVARFLTDTLWPALQEIGKALVEYVGAAVVWLADAWTDTLWPALKVVIAWVQNSLWPVLQAIGEFIGTVLVGVVKFLAAAWTDVLWPALKAVVGFITGTVIPAIGTFISWIVAIATKIGEVAWWVGTKVGEIIGFIVGLPGKIASVISTLWDGLTYGITVAKNWIVDRFNEVVGFVTGLPGRISSAASGMWDGLKEAFKGAMNWIIDKWNNLGFTFPTIDVPVIGKVGGWNFDTPNIPRFHTGTGAGGVPGQRGSEVPAILQAGEHVYTEAQERAVRAMMQRLARQAGSASAGLAEVGAGGSYATSVPSSIRHGDRTVQVYAETNADPDAIADAAAWTLEHSGDR
ncbi:COG5280 Phage-related minor tail protein [uncultured Caudovirales phage]|uniref:COG5280 Phage-related minor tail protein n=1 Tax=uncultured Caudovirales phage TaxID=2100421 RepID=A0A6J5RUI6_9CAUD|nr:COG5280 Phage-related minor tail protein [uncultured Caudovirales phage]